MMALGMDPAAPLLNHVVWGPGIYLVPRRDGRLILGATVEEKGFDATLTAGGMLSLLHAAWRALPGIEELPVLESWVGFRPRARDDAPLRTDAAGMDSGDHPGARVGHQHRYAVGRHHRQRQPRRRGDQTVCAVHGFAGVVDDRDVGAVHLVHPHDAVGQPDRGGQPVSVRRHSHRIVAHVVTEIERRERRFGHTPGTRGGHPAHPKGHAGGRVIRHGATVCASGA